MSMKALIGLSIRRQRNVPIDFKTHVGAKFCSLDKVIFMYEEYAERAGFCTRWVLQKNKEIKRRKLDFATREFIANCRNANIDSTKAHKLHVVLKDGIIMSKVRMIFVSFTGVDHHKKCTIFGVGLLHNETVEPYTWRLQKFFEADGKQLTLSSTGRANVDFEESRPIGDHAQLSAYQRVSIEDVLNPRPANPNPIASSSVYLADYSFKYSVDDDKRLTGLFWADGLCKLNYMEFGDVISFDATFKTNRYKMVFVPFTGMDNHCRNVTLGAGLLASKSIESYKWLLNSFLKSFGQQPKVVVTDQDPAMKQAIEEVFPISRHRLCMWHIMRKVADKADIKNIYCLGWTRVVQ
ncbi:protein FAR1-RELATED SEQUENCE 5-like [Helianthus annuus]|uniref:protein FAR1-RELATED SEQUENCE 5-like n=1 Tax=Helianthus annuus TaxID=4232 RepID=UPI001652E078|nr:protein FAR1-RELATED SEQUENCE 5-like [Helianthus annuus]